MSTSVTKKSYSVDISASTKATLIVEESFIKYLQTKIKVKRNGGQPGVLNDLVEVTGNGDGVVTVTVTTSQNHKTKKMDTATAKRQLKYLAKKYLAKEKLNRFLCVYAPTKDSYKLKFLAAGGADDEE